MTARIPQDPAAEACPRRRTRAAVPGGPGSAPLQAEPGGKTPAASRLPTPGGRRPEAPAGRDADGAALPDRTKALSGAPAGAALYAAARAKALKAQGRKRPADPQQNPGLGDPRIRVAAMMRPCACGHPLMNHWRTDAGRVTWCSIATGEGSCGCETYREAV